ncbi:hypothetical protein [Weissella sagaensis]|uniref:hypothetical protein n=1 Tax=Weissella sagaensis TaxID=2559928 RepID=UPI0013EC2F01|nr:hypothetical protein [Weissella sagaensis]
MMILVFIGIPVLIQLHVEIVYDLAKKMTPGNHSDWIQFWGSYLGIIPSGLVAWFVANKQIESSKENDKKNYLENMYLDDLKKLKDIMLLHKFSGQWNFPYNNGLIGCLTSDEIDMFRKYFLNIVSKDGKEEVRTDQLFEAKKIVHGLPISKRECIREDIDKLCDEILELAIYKPSEFKEMEDNYYITGKNKNKSPVDMQKFEDAENNWYDQSALFWKHIEIITNEFNIFEEFVNHELGIYYTL